MDFTSHRARSLARLSAYTLVLIFLISLLASLFPLPLEDPQRALAVLQELLERSTVPLVALLFLFAGLAGDALPAPWEMGLASWMGPLLRLVALGYLLTAIAVVAVAARLESTGITQLSGQVQSSLQELQNLRQEVNQYLAVPPEVAAQYPERIRRLIGYARYSPILGFGRAEGVWVD